MRLLYSISFFLLSHASFGQAYVKVHYDNQFDVYPKAITHSDTNGIVIAGMHDGDALVYKIDANGSVV